MRILTSTVGLMLALGLSSAVQVLDLDALYNDTTVIGQLNGAVYNETQEWGTYKPNLFFAVRDRTPSPVTTGLIWAFTTPDGSIKLRHAYTDQNGNNINGHFEYHDGWSFSRQIVEDPDANVRFEIDFQKEVTLLNDADVINGAAPDVKSQWKTLITIKPIKADQKILIVPFIYLTYEGDGLTTQQTLMPEGSPPRTKAYKVLRRRENDYYDFWEFTAVPSSAGFTV